MWRFGDIEISNVAVYDGRRAFRRTAAQRAAGHEKSAGTHSWAGLARVKYVFGHAARTRKGGMAWWLRLTRSFSQLTQDLSTTPRNPVSIVVIDLVTFSQERGSLNNFLFDCGIVLFKHGGGNYAPA